MDPQPSTSILLLKTYTLAPSGILQGFCTGLGPAAISRDPPHPGSGMLHLQLSCDTEALEHPAQSTKCPPEERSLLCGDSFGADLCRICSNDILFHATNSSSQKVVSLKVILLYSTCLQGWKNICPPNPCLCLSRTAAAGYKRARYRPTLADPIWCLQVCVVDCPSPLLMPQAGWAWENSLP